MGHDLRRVRVGRLGVDHAAALEVVDELVGERRRVIAGGDDDPCTAGDRRRALGQVRRYDQDLESFGKLVEREEAHAYPQTRTRDPLLEAVEDRQLRRRELASERADDRGDESGAGRRCCHTSVPVEDSQARDLATRAAFRAGRLAIARLGDPGYLRWKGLRDVVPEAAMLVQDEIVSLIRAECPNDAFLLEEGPEDEPLDVGAERLWIVDPICGSLNFVHGIPFFAISIALRVGGLLTDPEGGSWLHSTGGYVAGNPSLHQWALRAIKYVKQHPEP